VVSLIRLFQIHLGVAQKASLESSHSRNVTNSSTPPSNSGLLATGVIPAILVWRAANLILKRYGDVAIAKRFDAS
jgi:hypothetical protein